MVGKKIRESFWTGPNRRRRTIAYLIAVGMGMAGLVACTHSSNSQKQGGAVVKGGTLSVALATPPLDLDPHTATAAVDFAILHQIFATLVSQTPDHQFVPWLATSWKISADGRSYTFNLRHDVKFQDGTPFNADAVKFNLERIESPAEAATLSLSLLGPYDSAKVISPYVIQINMKQRYAPLLEALSEPELGIVSPTAAQKEGSNFKVHPVGAGPFKLTQFALNSKIVLSKSATYNWPPTGAAHTGPAYLSSIVFNIIPDASTRLGELRSGQTNAAESIDPPQVPALKANSAFQTYVLINPGLAYSYYINERKTPWDELDARKALRDAINVPLILKIVFSGVFKQAWGVLSPTTLGYDSSLAGTWKYDPDEAKSLLDGLGWKVGSGGYRYKNGQMLTASIVNLSPNRENAQNISTIVQQQLKQVGVRLTLTDLPLAPLAHARGQGTYSIYPASFLQGDPNVLNIMYGSANVPKAPSFAGFNWAFRSDPTMDKYIAQGQTASTQAGRVQAYKLAQQHIIDNIISIPIYYNPYIFATTSAVRGLAFNAANYPEFYSTWLH